MIFEFLILHFVKYTKISSFVFNALLNLVFLLIENLIGEYRAKCILFSQYNSKQESFYFYMKLVKNIISDVTKRIFCRKGKLFAEISIHWKKIIEEESVVLNSYPIKISTVFEDDKKINCLYIRCRDSYSAFFIQNSKDLIMDRVRIYVGFKAINKIVTKFSPI